MSIITDQIQINKSIAKNRILMPPLVCFNWADKEGFETVDRAKHYGDRAKGGTGIIVVEATAIAPEGRIVETELGLWRDEHIEQFEKMAKACQVEGSLVLVQLVHAGMKSIGEKVFSSSDQEVKGKVCEAMTLEQIDKVKNDFVNAAVRAYKAGLDGVEIHGAHGYLLSQFTSKETNKREDIYGGNLEGRMKLSLEIVESVRQATSENFIVGYRFGVNDPTFEEDIILAKKLEALGVDILDVSSGIGAEDVQVPADYNHSKITYMGTEIKKHVSIPVASVFGIRQPEQAIDLLENDYTDIVAVGRGLLADPNWTNKAIAGEEVNACYHCKGWCKYAKDGNQCPWRVKERK